MLTQNIVLALNDLLHSADNSPIGTNFITARRGKNIKGGGRGIICTVTDPLMASILLTIKDGFDELEEEANFSELTKEDLVLKMREKLSMCLSLLECE